MSLFAQKSRPEMVATIYGSSQAQLSERLGIDMRCDARGFTAGTKKPRKIPRLMLMLMFITQSLLQVFLSQRYQFVFGSITQLFNTIDNEIHGGFKILHTIFHFS